MSWRSALQAVIRLALVLSVALAGMTCATDDAEARRGGKVRTIKERASSHDDASTRRKSDEDHTTSGADSSGGTYIPVPRVRSREAARGSAETPVTDGLPAPRHLPAAAAMSQRPLQDIDVPGCPTGMICTVCLAGCSGEAGDIVDVQSKIPAPEPTR